MTPVWAMRRYRDIASPAGWVNAAGLPAVALPAAPSSNGLPIGVQLIADFGCDQALLELAGVFEAAAPGGWTWPAL